MNFKTSFIACAILLFPFLGKAQEGIPTYSDYLTDNYYLLHPSMAGAAASNQIRLTARQQWFDVENAPNLQTLSMNGRFGENTGVGGILFNDSNGNFSQTGVYLTFAYHLMFSRSTRDLNQLSFGLSAGFIQGKLDETGFGPDPIIEGIVQSDTYYNLDVGVSYNFLDFYAHFTAKNIIPQERDIFTSGLESNNQRRYLLSTGYVFSGPGFDSDWNYEPSIMFQMTDQTMERSIDLNGKVYRNMDFGMLWGGISYRRSFDGAEYFAGGGEVKNQQLQYITPFVGIDYRNFIFGYTYTYQMNSIVLSNGGFHQLTLGYDFGGRDEPYDCNCPSVN